MQYAVLPMREEEEKENRRKGESNFGTYLLMAIQLFDIFKGILLFATYYTQYYINANRLLISLAKKLVL